MIIRMQNGTCVEPVKVILQGKEIKCIPKNDRRKKETLGIYDSIKRATMIFSEITANGWNDVDYYEMPEE